MPWRRRVEPFARPLFHARARLSRGLTLGVRGLVTDAEGRVLLIEHTYIKGWYMPGGGVERGETAEAALAREMLEEAGVALTERPKLASVHDNSRLFPGDHVLVYRCGAFELKAPTSVGEIADLGWFAPDALPEGATPSTRARIREILTGETPQLHW
jgi:8-oxo-dGTP pyrophosphatase MutT (NUDIX family)